ncbi:DUF4193 family protein [Arthrobacter rhombi]|uniref:DUF4193 family protein n=1 Tax=Arthrobacter rhombi TaxID=71253 RepID=UPI003FD550F7
MAEDYDKVRPDVAERNEQILKNVQALDAPDAASEVNELDESQPVEGQELPGAIIDDELVVAVKPQTGTEFICGKCFLIRDHSMLDHKENGVMVCRECAAS